MEMIKDFGVNFWDGMIQVNLIFVVILKVHGKRELW
jgi:hypothetical protein